MAASVNTKGSNVVTRIALTPKLEVIAATIAGAMQETASLSETLGTLTREAGVLIRKNPDMLDPFVDGVRQLCESCGLTEGSFKVYMSNIRGVIRAMIDGYNPKDGQSLRAMYDAAPKGKGRQAVKTGARTEPKAAPSDDASDDSGDPINPIKSAPLASSGPTLAERRHAAMVVLFGHADDQLDAALAWAAKHELRFTNFVTMQVAFDAKPSSPVSAKKAPKVATMEQAAPKQGAVLGLGIKPDGKVGITRHAA